MIYMGVNYIVNLHYMNTSDSLKKAINCKILIAGDSYSVVSLNPSLFDSAKNISQGAEPYFITYWKLKKILSVKPPVHTILLSFSFHNISGFNDKKLIDPIWSSEMFKRSYPIEEFETLKGIEIDKQEYCRVLLKQMCLYPKKNHISYIGEYLNISRTLSQDFHTSIKRQYYYNNKNAGISTVSIDFLKSIIKLIEEHQIEIVLVSSPLHKEYMKRIPSNFKKAFFDLKTELTNSGIAVLDYGQATFQDRYFSNSDHLNEKGADRFTKMIIDRL